MQDTQHYLVAHRQAMNLMVKLQIFLNYLFIYYFLILADDKLLMFCTARPELQPHYPQMKRMRCLTSFNFPCTRIKSTNCQGVKTDKFNFGQREAKHDPGSTIYRAKPCNEQIELHSMVTLQKPAGDNYFH